MGKDANIQAFADELGISYQAVAKVLNGNSKAFSSANHTKAARVLKVNADWLLTGEGPMRAPPAVHQEPAFYAARPDQVEIPQYDAVAGMGRGIMLRDQPGLIRSWQVSPDWLQKNVHNYSSPRNLAIVTGFGDSMRPLFNPGDPLLVDRGVVSVEFDAIYFFRVGEEGFVKRLQRIPGNGLLAISENRSYRDWTITDNMDFEVFARVVKVWRGDDF